jgi:hypothetical protein
MFLLHNSSLKQTKRCANKANLIDRTKMITDHTKNFAHNAGFASHQLYEHGWRHVQASTQIQNANISTQHLDCNPSQDLYNNETKASK